MNNNKGCNIFLLTVCVCALFGAIIFLPVIVIFKVLDIFGKKKFYRIA
ncbi:MAG: hypothetical protein LUD81_01485 [Clostridiales bacterium]|nr:hypothetical protein [Clostridiales bacterium]